MIIIPDVALPAFRDILIICPIHNMVKSRAATAPNNAPVSMNESPTNDAAIRATVTANVWIILTCVVPRPILPVAFINVAKQSDIPAIAITPLDIASVSICPRTTIAKDITMNKPVIFRSILPALSASDPVRLDATINAANTIPKDLTASKALSMSLLSMLPSIRQATATSIKDPPIRISILPALSAYLPDSLDTAMRAVYISPMNVIAVNAPTIFSGLILPSIRQATAIKIRLPLMLISILPALSEFFPETLDTTNIAVAIRPKVVTHSNA